MADESDDESAHTAPVRKPYVRPEITKVALHPEEAVLGACKVGTVAGPVSGMCSVPTSCTMLGS